MAKMSREEKLGELFSLLGRSSNILYGIGWEYEMKKVDKIIETVEEELDGVSKKF